MLPYAMRGILCGFTFLAGLFMSQVANASFHLWKISEIYSNASGTVQFIELETSAGGQQFLSGQTLTASQAGGTTRIYTFPHDLPGDSAQRKFLIGTQGFADMGIVAPDFIVPNGFLPLTNGTTSLVGADTINYAAMPDDGVTSLNRDGSSGLNSPTNFAGVSGSIPGATLPTRLAIVRVNGGASPSAGKAFNVEVQAQDVAGKPQNVAAETTVILSRTAGTGALGGMLTCTMLTGVHACTVIGVTYAKAESGVVLTATQTPDDSRLTAGSSAPFTVKAGKAGSVASLMMWLLD